MTVSRTSDRSLASAAIPAPVRELLARLRTNGHDAFLVGGCVRDLLRGVPVEDFDVATSAVPEAVLAVFPRSVPIGLHHGTVMVPTASGPVDVTSFRAGPSLHDDLAHRDYTVNALAWDPVSERVIDPHQGVADLREGRLRAVGAARERLGEDPLRAVRAARLVAVLGARAEPALERALADCAPALAGVSRERIRRELEALLLAPDPAAGLALLRRTGLEAAILGAEAEPDAAAVVTALPPDLGLRLAGWLRGRRVEAILGRLRFPRRTLRRVARLVALHPVERGVDPANPVAVRRLLRRTGEEDLAALLALREAEVKAASLPQTEARATAARVAALRQAVVRIRQAGALALRRHDLALDGRAVMAILGCRPGPLVGRALDWLTECVIRDPSCNEPARLRALLEVWQRDDGGTRAPVAPRSRRGDTSATDRPDGT